MRILPDRDRHYKFYLDEDVWHTLHNGDILEIGKGYRFDGHSTKIVGKWAISLTIFTALLYFFPLFILYALITVSSLLIASWILVLLFFRAYDKDIRAALIHDLLLDLKPWHRYSTKFINKEYQLQMKQHSYGLRKTLMPLAVNLWGLIKLFEYRGEYDGSVHISVKIDVL